MSVPTFDGAVHELIDELTAAFGVIDASNAAAFFPGIAVDHQVVQQGVVNPLRVAQWLVTFDSLMTLRPGHAISTLPPGGTSATALYSTIVNTARPVDPAAVAGLQLLKRIAIDKGLLLQVVPTEPLGSTPPDWPLPDTLQWQTASTRSVPQPPPPADENPPNTVVRMPGLDGLSPEPGPVVLLTWIATVGDHVEEGASLAIASDDGAKVEVDIPAPVAGTLLAIEAPAGEHVPVGAVIGIVGPAPAPVEVVVELEHALILLTRRVSGERWWDDLLLADPTWFVPGRSAGGLLPTPTTDAAAALPFAVLLVRNVVVQNTNPTPTTMSSWPAMQAIGVLAAVLPTLPPRSDPDLPAAALVTVPNLTLMTLDMAGAAAEALGLVPASTAPPQAQVVHQSPEPGTQVARGSVVNLAVSTG